MQTVCCLESWSPIAACIVLLFSRRSVFINAHQYHGYVTVGVTMSSAGKTRWRRGPGPSSLACRYGGGAWAEESHSGRARRCPFTCPSSWQYHGAPKFRLFVSMMTDGDDEADSRALCRERRDGTPWDATVRCHLMLVHSPRERSHYKRSCIATWVLLGCGGSILRHMCACQPSEHRGRHRQHQHTIS